MVPKIIFVYSWIYDQEWKNCIKKRCIKIYPEKVRKYPSPIQILNYIEKIKKLWEKEGKNVLMELSKVSGLKWKSGIINCYVVGDCIPFSDPLTVPIYSKDLTYFIDTLVHELIHQLFIQSGNYERSKKAWRYIDRKYKNESHNTRIHIPLYAIHSYIYLKVFNEKRLERDIKLMNHLRDYRRAWQIVEEEGYKKIVEEFKKRLL